MSNQCIAQATDPIDIFVSSGYDVTAAPLSYADLPVSMSLQVDEDIKTIDLFKGLLTQFNLVAYAEQEQSKTIRLETFDTWMRQGEVKNWTDKYNAAKRISIKNPVSEEPRELRFSNVEDEDRISRLAKDQTPNFQYGTLRTISNSNLTSGEKKVESSFSPTPPPKLFVYNQPGCPAAANIGLRGNVVLPELSIVIASLPFTENLT